MTNKATEVETFGARSSGSEVIFNANHQESLRHRNQNPSPSINATVDTRNQTANQTANPRRRNIFYIALTALVIVVLLISTMLYFFNDSSHEEESDEESNKLFGSITKLAKKGLGGISQLGKVNKQDTSSLINLQVAFNNLGVIMNDSGVVVKNGPMISQILFDLGGNIQEAGSRLSEFVHHAENFFWTLSSELNAINDKLDQGLFMKLFGGERVIDVEFIKERLEMLESKIPNFQETLARVIDIVLKIEERRILTQIYLRAGEKEAEEKITDLYLEKIVDNAARKRALEERRHVLQVLKIVKQMAPGLLHFNDFLTKYRIELQTVSEEVKRNRLIKKPSKETLKALIRAAKQLEARNRNLEQGTIGYDSKTKPIEDDDETEMNNDCTEFDIEFTKSNDIYLRNIRIWSSEFINAIAFYYSDGSIKTYGEPLPSVHRDFAWYKGEKIKRLCYAVGSVVYRLEITTTQGRTTGWIGNEKGHHYCIVEGNEYNGLHGSFSNHLCTIGISHG